MRKRVPLNAIRAFEAVARHASVAKAADELCVTPTAVSHQIRLLEEFLQTKLFQRRNSRMVLTPQCAANLAHISRALDLIDEAVLCLGKEPDGLRRRLSVAASASVASLWLMPRIGRFLATAPDLDLDLSTFLSRKEAESRECDIRICNWQSQLDCLIEPLLEEEIVPVCTPEIARRYGPDAGGILRHAPLIHVDRRSMGFEQNQPDWARYLAEYGIARADVAQGVRLNQASTAIEAARAGVGVLLGRSLLIEAALERGDLVTFSEPFPARCPYYMLTPWQSEARGRLQSFKDWLLDSVRPNPMVHAA